MKSSGFVLADHANHGRIFIVLFHPVAIAVTAADSGATSAIDGRHNGRRKLMDGRGRVITAVVMVTVKVIVAVVMVVVDIVRADDDRRPTGTNGIIQSLGIRPLLLLFDGSSRSLGIFPEPLH